jgi:formylglycine-generating enzyme required for sulfatase activity
LLKAPFDDAAAKKAQLDWADRLKTTVVATNPIGISLVLVPAGEFMMGMGPTEVEPLREIVQSRRQSSDWLERQYRAAPRHCVTLRKPWFMGTTEVTLGQFRQFVDATGYVTEAEQYGFGESGQTTMDSKVSAWMKGRTWRTPGYSVTDGSPVSQVTWNDAVSFCNWLSACEKLSPCYREQNGGGWSLVTAGDGYRLPTEAEWEYACKAGSTNEPAPRDGLAWLKEHAWFNENQNGGARPVAMKRPNAFGLFDMRGNVFEWCHDWYRPDYYLGSPPDDPLGPSSGGSRVQRGGGWNYDSLACHSGFRTFAGPSGRHNHRGFRVVRVTTIEVQDMGGRPLDGRKSARHVGKEFLGEPLNRPWPIGCGDLADRASRGAIGSPRTVFATGWTLSSPFCL